MSNWKFVAVDKNKPVENVKLIGFIHIPQFLGLKKKPSPDVSGYVEADSEQEARELANRQITRRYPNCKLQKIWEVKYE